MPIIPAPGKLRQKVVINLRTGLESELLATLSFVLLCETLFQERTTKSESLATFSYKGNDKTLYMKLCHRNLNIHWIAVPCKIEGNTSG